MIELVILLLNCAFQLSYRRFGLDRVKDTIDNDRNATAIVLLGDNVYSKICDFGHFHIIIEMIRINTRRLFQSFGTEALNIRITDKDPLTKERIDSHLDRYGHLFRAFVLKRRLLRSEIWPKIHIIDDVPQSQKHHLGYQKLFSIKKSMRDEVMMAIAKNDPSKINSAFIISNFSEDYFKPMLDEYLDKVLVCGKAPSDAQSQSEVQKKAKELYWAFYFGQKRSSLQRQLQQAYLSAKQSKHLRAQRHKMMSSHLVEQVKWTEREQRILEEKKNWQPANPNLTDLNYRTYFEPLEYTVRKDSFLKCSKLIKDWTFLDDLKFKWTIGKYYDPTSSKYFDWVLDKIFVRVMNHIRSTQFTSNLNIPHDYMIQAQINQIHFWLLTDRLKKIGTVQSITLAKRINFVLHMELMRNAQSLNIKKSNILTTTLQRMLEMNSTILQLHFNRSEVTKNNHYKGIDAMVWSIAFAEKVHRYADQVYIFADYLIQNFNHMQKHTQQDIFNGIIEFDSYLVSPNYRQLIEKVNPPLSAKQFQKQFNSNTANKDYYYSKIQKEIQEAMTYDPKLSQSKIDTSFSLAEFLQPFRNFRMKYQTLGSIDHYSKMEQQKKQQEQLQKKSFWKSGKDEVKGIHQEFESIQNIKNTRRRLNEEQKDKKV